MRRFAISLLTTVTFTGLLVASPVSAAEPNLVNSQGVVTSGFFAPVRNPDGISFGTTHVPFGKNCYVSQGSEVFYAGNDRDLDVLVRIIVPKHKVLDNDDCRTETAVSMKRTDYVKAVERYVENEKERYARLLGISYKKQ